MGAIIKNGRSRQNEKGIRESPARIALKKDYHDIAVNEICPLAGKTKMTFYQCSTFAAIRAIEAS